MSALSTKRTNSIGAGMAGTDHQSGHQAPNDDQRAPEGDEGAKSALVAYKAYPHDFWCLNLRQNPWSGPQGGGEAVGLDDERARGGVLAGA